MTTVEKAVISVTVLLFVFLVASDWISSGAKSRYWTSQGIPISHWDAYLGVKPIDINIKVK